jgi:hypothetical protein
LDGLALTTLLARLLLAALLAALLSRFLLLLTRLLLAALLLPALTALTAVVRVFVTHGSFSCLRGNPAQGKRLNPGLVPEANTSRSSERQLVAD